MSTEILFAPIPHACKIGGFERSKMYQLLAAGEIRSVKLGRKTLIDLASLRTFLANLPTATFTPSREG